MSSPSLQSRIESTRRLRVSWSTPRESNIEASIMSDAWLMSMRPRPDSSRTRTSPVSNGKTYSPFTNSTGEPASRSWSVIKSSYITSAAPRAMKKARSASKPSRERDISVRTAAASDSEITDRINTTQRTLNRMTPRLFISKSAERRHSRHQSEPGQRRAGRHRIPTHRSIAVSRRDPSPGNGTRRSETGPAAALDDS